MHGVTGSAVDDGRVRNILSVMDQDGPDVDEYEENNIGKFLQRKDEREDVIRDRLREAIHRVEGVRGIRRWHDPLVMRLMEVLVDQGVV